MLWLVLLLVDPLQSLKPVILVPGALASQIKAKLKKTESRHDYCPRRSDWYTLWLKLQSMLPPEINCWADNFRMEFNNGVFSNVRGVETRVGGFGETHSLDYIDNWHYIAYLKPLADSLMELPGAKEGVTVRTAPYDFRYSPPSKESKRYFNRLKKLIEGTYTATNKTKVVLVSHSLGGLTTSTFLATTSQLWRDTFIHAWVSASGVFGGAVKEVKVLVSEGILTNLPAWITSRSRQRDLARTIMGNYFVLPREGVWGVGEVLLETPQVNYTVGNLDQLFIDMGAPDGTEKWKTVRNASSIADPGVKTYCFNGKDIATSASFYYKDQKDFPDEIPETVTGDGDGTVPARSLQVCHKWNSTVNVTEYSGDQLGEHNKILQNGDFVKSIIDLIA